MARKNKKCRKHLKGMGTLEPRPNGIYLARWVVNGHKYSKSTGTSVRTEAEKVLATLVKPFQNEGEVARLAAIETAIKVKRGEMEAEENEKPALKLADAFDSYLKNVNVSKISEGTERVYLDMVHRLEAFVKGYRQRKITELREFTPSMAKDFLTELKAEVKGATFNRYLNFFKLVWRTLEKEARLTCNPWEGFKKQKLDTESRENFTMEEIKRIIGSLDGEWRILFMMGYYTGLRLVDCCHATFEKLNCNDHTLSVVPQKTKHFHPEPIDIPLAPELFNLIMQIPEEKRTGFIMPECARMYDANLINYRIKKILEKNGIKTNKEGSTRRKVCVHGFHSLRSGFVTYAGEAGIPLPIIQIIVGHGSPRMTAHYFRTAKDSLAQCVNTIPSLMGEGKERENLVLEAETMKLLRSRLMQNESMDEGLRRLLGGEAVAHPLKTDKPIETFNMKAFMDNPLALQLGYRKVS